jgi:hypothetical protein
MENHMKKVIPIVFALSLMVTTYAVYAQQSTTVNTVTATETVGTISEVGPDALMIRSETNSSPMNYTYTKSTTYVDDAGVPVSIETVKSGMPVTVHYTQEGDRMVATKVVVRKTMTTTDGPTIQKRQTEPPRRLRPNKFPFRHTRYSSKSPQG